MAGIGEGISPGRVGVSPGTTLEAILKSGFIEFLWTLAGLY